MRDENVAQLLAAGHEQVDLFSQSSRTFAAVEVSAMGRWVANRALHSRAMLRWRVSARYVGPIRSFNCL